MTETMLDIERLLSKLRGQKARHVINAADVQQHIDLIERGQAELFAAEEKSSKK